jgi:hypothetical protein
MLINAELRRCKFFCQRSRHARVCGTSELPAAEYDRLAFHSPELRFTHADGPHGGKFVQNRFIGRSAHLTSRDAAQPNLPEFLDFNAVP